MHFFHICPQVWWWVVVHTVRDVSFLLRVPVLLLLSLLITSLSPLVESGMKGPKLYGRIVICVVSWPLWRFSDFPDGFSLDLHILSPCHILWPISPLSHCVVLSLPLLRQIMGVVLFVVPPLCDPPSSNSHSLHGILLVKRLQLTQMRHAIMLYFLVTPICNYLRPVLVLVLEVGSHHLQMAPEYLRSVLLVSMLLGFLDWRCCCSGVTEFIYDFWFWVALLCYLYCWW